MTDKVIPFTQKHETVLFQTAEKVETNSQLILENREILLTNQKSIERNQSSIEQNQSSIEQNRKLIERNHQSIQQNQKTTDELKEEQHRQGLVLDDTNARVRLVMEHIMDTTTLKQAQASLESKSQDHEYRIRQLEATRSQEKS